MLDWTELGKKVGAISHGAEQGSDALARAAITEIIGADRLREAVDFYLSHAPGAELCRSVLWLLHPMPAMERCYEVYKTASDVELRRDAIELLRVVADARVLPWLEELINDEDSGTQVWVARLIDQLLWSQQVEVDDVAEYLARLEHHPNPQCRAGWVFIQGYLKDRTAT